MGTQQVIDEGQERVMEIPTLKSAERVIYEAGVFVGRKGLARQIAVDLDAISDEDGSLSGGDCVEYIYQLLDRFGAVETCLQCMVTHAVGPCPHCPKLAIELPDEMPSIRMDGDDLVGTREDMLRLARTIHDVIEGDDVDTNPTE